MAKYNYLMTACLDNERVVAISLQNGFDMCCYSMTDGTVLWNVATPMHEDSRYFGDSDPVFLARTSDFL